MHLLLGSSSRLSLDGAIVFVAVLFLLLLCSLDSSRSYALSLKTAKTQGDKMQFPLPNI
jgi:hypothetical protein